MKFVSKLWKSIKPLSQKEREEAYFARATDLTDLERRIKKIENSNLSGWV